MQTPPLTGLNLLADVPPEDPLVEKVETPSDARRTLARQVVLGL